MPRLLSKMFSSPQARQRIRAISAVVFALAAVVSWWGIKVEGPSPARLITAIATSIVAVLEVFLPKRRWLLRRFRSAPGPN